MAPKVSFRVAWDGVGCGHDAVQGHCPGPQLPPFYVLSDLVGSRSAEDRIEGKSGEAVSGHG